MEYCEDEDDCFTNFEFEFPSIVLDDTLTSSESLSWEPTVSPLNNDEIEFKISFDESDDEDYMNLYVAFGISFDPKRYYKDGVHTRILWRPRMVKIIYLCTDLVLFADMAPLPPRDQIYIWLKYQVEGFTKNIMHDYEKRLETIWGRLSEGHFIGRLAANVGLISDQGLRGLSVVTRELLMINVHELARLNICGGTWAWVALGQERQLDAAIGALEPLRMLLQLMRRLARVGEEVREMRQSILGLRGDVDRFITDQSSLTLLRRVVGNGKRGWFSDGSGEDGSMTCGRIREPIVWDFDKDLQDVAE
nr:hypothetical protein [Tanacetum cinerariifolium]